jgi:hypothetical protein
MVDPKYFQVIQAALEHEPQVHAISGQKVIPVYTVEGEPDKIMLLVKKMWVVGTPIEEILRDINRG